MFVIPLSSIKSISLGRASVSVKAKISCRMCTKASEYLSNRPSPGCVSDDMVRAIRTRIVSTADENAENPVLKLTCIGRRQRYPVLKFGRNLGTPMKPAGAWTMAMAERFPKLGGIRTEDF